LGKETNEEKVTWPVVMIPMSQLEYNKPRNTEERMAKKVEGCQFTKRVFESIKKIGLQNPLVVEKRGEDRYGVLLGSNRLASLKVIGGWDAVPCIVTPDRTIATLKAIRKTYKRVEGMI